MPRLKPGSARPFDEVDSDFDIALGDDGVGENDGLDLLPESASTTPETSRLPPPSFPAVTAPVIIVPKTVAPPISTAPPILVEVPKPLPARRSAAPRAASKVAPSGGSGKPLPSAVVPVVPKATAKPQPKPAGKAPAARPAAPAKPAPAKPVVAAPPKSVKGAARAKSSPSAPVKTAGKTAVGKTAPGKRR